MSGPVRVCFNALACLIFRTNNNFMALLSLSEFHSACHHFNTVSPVEFTRASAIVIVLYCLSVHRNLGRIGIKLIHTTTASNAEFSTSELLNLANAK